jgi:predicted ferric reductase/Ca2+-binding EF-hand superfamily protein
LINTSKKRSALFLIDLKNRFKIIAGEDQLIDRTEFKNGLRIKNELISNRLFDLFDSDKSGFIDIIEFTETIKSIVEGDKISKIQFAFDLHDLDNNGFIDRKELKILIQESFFENNLEFDRFQIDLLVNDFFSVADKDNSGTIDYKEFLDTANNYPDFINSITVNPIFWLISDRYEKTNKLKIGKGKSKKIKINNLQVQDIVGLKSLLIPKIISFYNRIINPKKNKVKCMVSGFKLLPSDIMQIEIKFNNKFEFNPGDYIYLNTSKISIIDWHPFTIIEKVNDNKLLLQIKVNNQWTKKLHKRMLETFKIKRKFNQRFEWSFEVDGPYGSKFKESLNSEYLIMVGAGHGISKFAPILKDIRQKLKYDKHNIKEIDLHWLVFNQSYFAWFAKILNDFKNDNLGVTFNYHTYFVDKTPDEVNDKLLFISKDVLNERTEIKLIKDLWNGSSFGSPDWHKELKSKKSKNRTSKVNLFYSGPDNFSKELKDTCYEFNINFNNKNF